jgi:transposase
MPHITGFGRDQLLLLPEAVDDYVEAENPVRFIDAFVEGLDLVGAGFARVEAKATGRPGYAPGDLLKLYIYRYLNRVRSSRRLEREARRLRNRLAIRGSQRQRPQCQLPGPPRSRPTLERSADGRPKGEAPHVAKSLSASMSFRPCLL